MSKSRYTDTGILDGNAYRTFRLPKLSAGLKNIDYLENVKTIEYVYKAGDRLDHLAARFLGNDEYWWVIALVNGINYPFSSGGLTPGRALRIPNDAKDILNKILG